MGKSIHADSDNNIFVSETSTGDIEIAVGLDGSAVCIRVNDLNALFQLSEKMIVLNNTLFQGPTERQ